MRASELPIAYTVTPCNENDKLYFEPLPERIHPLGVKFRVVRARVIHFMKYAAITADREIIPTYVKLAWKPIESARYPIITGEKEPNVKARV